MLSLPAFSASLFYDTVNAYYKTAAVKSAIELGVFSAIGGERRSAAEVAHVCKASARGIRILCYYLVSIGFMQVDGDKFYLTRDMRMLLDEGSRGYLGGTIGFLLSPYVMGSFSHLTTTIREGRVALEDGGLVSVDNDQWVAFARAMAPMMALPSMLMAEVVDLPLDRPLRVLDVACGHGLFGIAFAQRYPQAHVTFTDWSNVLDVAHENALRSGIEARSTFIHGDAFSVPFEGAFDVILLTNFLHHFDMEDCTSMLKKCHESLSTSGVALVFEIVAEEDRLSPPLATTFSMMMLGTTPGGEVYTHSEYIAMAKAAGFGGVEVRRIPPAHENVIVCRRT